MKELGGVPFPSVAFMKLLSAHGFLSMQVTLSGETTLGVKSAPLGAARFGGKVTNVWLTVGASGKDDTNGLHISGEVYINGTSCLSTQPAISHVSGEASQQKTTKVTGDTGVTQAVMDTDNNEFTSGDIFTYDLDVARTASPTTEISNVILVVDIEPIKG